LCGVLGGPEHWTDAVARPGVFTRNTDAGARRRERMNRVAAANRVLSHYQMNLADLQGSAFVLSTATGKTERKLPSQSRQFSFICAFRVGDRTIALKA
jgi:hypothetical protein